MAPEARQVFDTEMMRIALRMAERGLGTTAPNPAVGAVIADERTGEVIARGWTSPRGRPHAEPQALLRAGHRARGATMYVTLEPCSHHGMTPPCADAIANAGIGRVVCAIEDPDPRVAGSGLARLRQAGVATERGVLAEAAHWLTAGHILRVTERRPFITAKLALDATGAVPRGNSGQPQWATGPAARAAGHLLRARADAILVGRRTVLDDDPLLTCRLPGLEGRSPIRVVLARDLGGLEASRLVNTARQRPTWVMCAEASDASHLDATGVEIIRSRTVDGRLWLPAAMESLVARGVTRVLIEGGAATWSAFSRAGLIDEVVLFRAEGATREASRETVLAALSRYVEVAGFDIYDRRTMGGDDMLTLRRQWHRGDHRMRRQ